MNLYTDIFKTHLEHIFSPCLQHTGICSPGKGCRSGGVNPIAGAVIKVLEGRDVAEIEQLPALLEDGFTYDEISQLLIHNPAEVFGIRVRGFSDQE